MAQDLTTTSILALFETNKEQRQSFALDVISKLESGEVDPLQVHLWVKCIEDITKLMIENTVYKSIVLEEAQKRGEKSFPYRNAKIEIKEVGTKYDFTKCGDPIYDQLEQMSESIKASLKERADFLKTVPA